MKHLFTFTCFYNGNSVGFRYDTIFFDPPSSTSREFTQNTNAKKLYHRCQFKLLDKCDVIRVVEALRSYVKLAPKGTRILIKEAADVQKQVKGAEHSQMSQEFLQEQSQSQIRRLSPEILNSDASKQRKLAFGQPILISNPYIAHASQLVPLDSASQKLAVDPAYTVPSSCSLHALTTFKTPKPPHMRSRFAPYTVPLCEQSASQSSSALPVPLYEADEQSLPSNQKNTCPPINLTEAAERFDGANDDCNWILSQTQAPSQTQPTQPACYFKAIPTDELLRNIDNSQTQISQHRSRVVDISISVPSQRSGPAQSEYLPSVCIDPGISDFPGLKRHQNKENISTLFMGDHESVNERVNNQENVLSAATQALPISRNAFEKSDVSSPRASSELQGLLAEGKLSKDDEDALIKEIIMDPDWVQFVERVSKMPAGFRL